MADATYRSRWVFEGDDEVSDDIRRVQRNLGDLEGQTQSFGDVLRGPAGLLAGMYLTEEALQNLIEGYHELAVTMAGEGVASAQAYVESTDNVKASLQGLGETLVETTGGPIAASLNALAAWVSIGGFFWDTVGNMTEALKIWREEGITPAREEFRKLMLEDMGELAGRGFVPTVGPFDTEEDEDTRRTLQHFSELREQSESIGGQVEMMSGRIQDDLVPSLELVGIVGADSLEMVGLTAEETNLTLQNTAINAADGFEGELLPALDAVIDRLITASEAGDVLGDVLRGAAQGFIFGGPIGAAVGAAVPFVQGVGRDSDVPRG